MPINSHFATFEIKNFKNSIDNLYGLEYNISNKGGKVKMKRRNLFLSLISSVLVAVAIVTVTIVTVIQPKKKNNGDAPVVTTPIVDAPVQDNKEYESMNEFERNGSKEYPYVIYSADSFVNMLSKFGGKKRIVTKPVTEIVEQDGKQVEVLKVDEKGYVIFEPVLDSYGNETEDVYYFEFVKDVDFAGVEFVTLFNYGKPFIGNIDGKGFALNNISIDVTTENLESKFSYILNGYRYSRIAIFGEMNNASIKDLKINALDVNVANDVYGYISSNLDNDFAEMVVGSLAGIANNSTIENVSINASVAGASYIDGSISGNNAVGGVVAIVNNFKMTKANVNVAIAANSGRDYLVGGIAAYGRGVEVIESEIAVDIKTTYSRKLIMAGMFAYAKTIEAKDTNVNLTVTEVADAQTREAYVSSLTTDAEGNEVLAKAGDMSTIAGLVGILRADDSTQEATFTNIKVNSNIDFDGMFAGAIFDVYSKNKVTFGLVELTDVIVNSNVNVLVAHGFARQLVATTVSYTDTTAEGYYNIKLTGNVEFDKYTGRVNVYDALKDETKVVDVEYHGASMLNDSMRKYISCNGKQLFVQVSADINATIMLNGIDADSIRGNYIGGYKVIAG